jgi:hypothetical protein
MRVSIRVMVRTLRGGRGKLGRRKKGFTRSLEGKKETPSKANPTATPRGGTGELLLITRVARKVISLPFLL